MLDPTRLDPRSLLGRPELPLDWTAARHALSGKRILVTGAGGSVGVHLAERLLDLAPSRLTLLDHHDHALFALRRRLDEWSQNDVGGPHWGLVLADVRNATRMARVLDEARPDVIFHLAAYKHVPFGEEFPEETFEVNVLATEQLLSLAAERGVERFVYPSSDKAVNPPSLYGATKRLSETLVGKFARRLGRQYVVTRFVNILGTNGSAIETFAAQVAGGQSLTITDERMTRYWVSMQEAAWLVVQAATVGDPGSVLMLDATDEVAIVEMARRVESLVAPGRSPGPVRITGLRPGERLREELISGSEKLELGPCAGLLAVHHRLRQRNLDTIDDLMASLRDLATVGNGAALKSRVMEAAISLQ